MTIRRRLILSFGTILALFGLNLVISFWGNHWRQSAVEDLRRAVRRQLLISGIHENLDRIQKQISLLGQGGADPRAAASQEETAQFHAQLGSITQQAAELRELSSASEHEAANNLSSAYAPLRKSWSEAYGNFGVRHTQAITELAVHADPFAQNVLNTLLPRLQQDEDERVRVAA